MATSIQKMNQRKNLAIGQNSMDQFCSGRFECYRRIIDRNARATVKEVQEIVSRSKLTLFKGSSNE
jgi:hypothetical protein